MKFQYITTFLAIAENMSFSKAAEQLGCSQSTVTFQIKELEKELCTSLFERMNKRVCLTPDGYSFLAYAKQITSETQQLLLQFGKRELCGELRIGIWQTLNSFVFADVIREFHIMCPQVKLIVTEPSYAQTFDELSRNQLDMAYILDAPVVRKDIISYMNAMQPMVFAVGMQHPLANRESLTLADLAPCDFLMTQQESCYLKQLSQHFHALGLSIKGFLESNNTEPLKQLAVQNYGIVFLPEFAVADEIRSGTLRKLLVSDTAYDIQQQVLCHKNKQITTPMHIMVDVIKKLCTGC